MASIEDRWWDETRDPATGVRVRSAGGAQHRTKTARFGIGLRYRVRYVDPDGAHRSKSFPDGQLGMARRFKTKMENDLYAGTYRSPEAGKILIADWCATYLQGRSQDESSQIILDSLIRNQILPFLGLKMLKNIDLDTLRLWKVWLDRPARISVNYQAAAWDLVSSMLDAAVEANIIEINPCKNKSISPPQRIINRITPWPEGRVHAIWHALSPKHDIAVPLGAAIGLRPGEILAFSPDNIDREKLVYNCDRQVVYRRGTLAFKLPKDHKTRTIPITGKIIEMVDEYMAIYPPTIITLPWAEQERTRFQTVTLLLTDMRGQVWRASVWLDTAWRPAFACAGIAYRRQLDGMHALRHFYASFMLSRGVTLKDLAAFLGHASEAFTLKTYVHLTPTSYERARTAIDAMLPPTQRAPGRSSNARLGIRAPSPLPRRGRPVTRDLGRLQRSLPVT